MTKFYEGTSLDRIHLTLPDQSAAHKLVAGKSTSGQGGLMTHLRMLPLAQLQLGRPTGVDHVHLGRFDDTDYVQWWGRCADGYHRPIGQIMQIIEAVR